MSNIYEVETRGRLSIDDYTYLLNLAKKLNLTLDTDDRETVFFILSGKTLKVTKRLSNNNSKIALKLGDIATAKFQEEIEIPFNGDDFTKAVKTFRDLGFKEIQYTFQKRSNFTYKGIVFSIKWSLDWGYHFEAEIVTSDKTNIEPARQNLLAVVHELGLTTMSDDEFKNECDRIDQKHKDSKPDKFPLFIKAELKELPEKQVLDSETISWIEAFTEHPLIDMSLLKGKLVENDLLVIKKYLTQVSWYKNKDLLDSIHGLLHHYRVITYSYLLAKMLNLPQENLYIICASLHDTQRQNDKDDKLHGQRAAEFFRSSNFDTLSDLDKAVIADSLYYHDIDYPEIPDTLSDKTMGAIDIIKASDALDRFRLPKLKWWYNSDKVKLSEANELIEFAKSLVVETECKLKNKQDPDEYIQLLRTLYV